MPRFAAVTTLLLAAVMAAGAGALWYGGWVPDLRFPEAASAPSPTQSPEQMQPVERAALAIRAHDVGAVRQYLAAGGDPDAADGEGEILLIKAVLHGTPEIVDVLLAAGADPNLPGKNGLGPLAIAALAGRHAMLERLMQANAAGATAAEGTAAYAPSAAAGGQPSTPDTAGAPPSALASFGDGEPAQALLPVEPFATMAGLSINPIARPAPGAAAASTSAPGASTAEPAASPSSPTADPPATESASSAAVPTAAAAAGEVPKTWVSAAQRRLGQLGFYQGPITGFAGPLTADAVKRYQAVAGVPQDGIVSVDLLRRIGATVEAPRPAPATVATVAASSAATGTAPAPAASPGVATAAAAPVVASQRAPVPAGGPGLQQVRNALGQEFNSATRPDALRQHCQANANAWVYDEAIGRSLFCRDLIGSPPR